MSTNRPIITLTTDFGVGDHFAGVMKGVIFKIAPDAQVVDVTHGIASHDILDAAITLQSSYSYFPKGTIHVIVVDPGVGTSRRPLLLTTDDYSFVGPDNGMFWPVYQQAKGARAIHLTAEEYFHHPVSHTFHGRDIFAPVAAWLSRGVDPLKMGQLVEAPMPLAVPEVRRIGCSKLIGTILRIDKFGNLITNLTPDNLPPSEKEAHPYIIQIGHHRISQFRRTYAGAEPGEIFAIWGSSGRLEIAMNQASAAELLQVRRNQEFDIELKALMQAASLSGIMEW